MAGYRNSQRSSPGHCRQANDTYQSFIESVSKHGITAKMPGNHAAEAARPGYEEPHAGNKEKEGLYGRGLLHYREWWERKEADVFVDGGRITGVPIFNDKNTLRIVSGEHSYFVPLEKIGYIRTDDGFDSGRKPPAGGQRPPLHKDF